MAVTPGPRAGHIQAVFSSGVGACYFTSVIAWVSTVFEGTPGQGHEELGMGTAVREVPTTAYDPAALTARVQALIDPDA